MSIDIITEHLTNFNASKNNVDVKFDHKFNVDYSITFSCTIDIDPVNKRNTSDNSSYVDIELMLDEE